MFIVHKHCGMSYLHTCKYVLYGMSLRTHSPTSPTPPGIIPRAVAYLFNGIEERRRKAVRERKTPPSFEVHAQFLELYHEQIRDLFDHSQRMDGKGLHIHEDAFGNIYLKGATMKKITSEEEVRSHSVHEHVFTVVFVDGILPELTR